MENSCMGMCLTPATSVSDLRFTYVYHPRDKTAPPAVVFHDGDKCPDYGKAKVE